MFIKNSDLNLKRQMRKMQYANANLLLNKLSKCSINVKCYLRGDPALENFFFNIVDKHKLVISF